MLREIRPQNEQERLESVDLVELCFKRVGYALLFDELMANDIADFFIHCGQAQNALFCREAFKPTMA